MDANDVLQKKLDFRIAPSDEAQCPFTLQKLDSVGTISAIALFLKLGLVWLTLAVARNEPDIHGKLARNFFDLSVEGNRKRAFSRCIFECAFKFLLLIGSSSPFKSLGKVRFLFCQLKIGARAGCRSLSVQRDKRCGQEHSR